MNNHKRKAITRHIQNCRHRHEQGIMTRSSITGQMHFTHYECLDCGRIRPILTTPIRRHSPISPLLLLLIFGLAALLIAYLIQTLP